MQGVIVDLLIAAVLFTPIGFLAGYLQHKKTLKLEEDEKKINEKNSTI